MSFSEEKRKKLIVPAVALMMCAVAMIGIGYAAVNSSVTNQNNTLTNNVFSIDLYSSAEGNTAIDNEAFNEGKVVFSTHKTVGDSTTTYYDVANQIVTMNSSDVYIGAGYTDNNTNTGTVELNVHVKKSATLSSDASIASIIVKINVSGTEYNYSISNFSTGADSEGFITLTPETNKAPLTLGEKYKITVTATVTEKLKSSSPPTLPTFDFRFTVTDSNHITTPES